MKAWCLRMLLVCSIFLTGCDRHWKEADIAATKTAGNRIVESLESYKQKSGGYPGKLDELVKNGYFQTVPDPVGKQRKWDYNVHDDRSACRLTAWDRKGRVPHSLEWTSSSKEWVLDIE